MRVAWSVGVQTHGARERATHVEDAEHGHDVHGGVGDAAVEARELQLEEQVRVAVLRQAVHTQATSR